VKLLSQNPWSAMTGGFAFALGKSVLALHLAETLGMSSFASSVARVRADPHSAGALALAVPIPIRELEPRFEEKDKRWLPMKGIA
ncbi:hypothetical protein, partial [Pseudomonas aeruginosa]|uniref:hypothetical protein n=1 Tax=Pseudomonas aeruginosa TaxID=287 RepID=UPI0023309E56